MLDPVPWFVGGGAQHSPEVARLLAFAATGGAEGVVNVSDLKVVPLSVPGTAVEALPGAALVRNRGAGGDSQTYVARNVTATQVEIAATGSSGGRSDLVVVQVEDPNVAGEPWQPPADPAAGPYVFVRVIPNVPAGTTRLQDVPGYEGRSAVTLARVDLPASTGTVTAAMIKDLRRLARPRREQVLRVVTPPSNRKVQVNTNWHNWPTTANEFLNVDVPEWATQMQVQTIISGIGARNNTYGDLRTMIGSVAFVGAWDSTVTTTSDPFQFMTMMAGSATIPTAMRGTSVGIGMDAKAGSTGQNAANMPWTTGAARIAVQIEFNEVPV